MAPMYGHPNYDFLVEDSYTTESGEYIDKHEVNKDENGLTQMTFWYLIMLLSMLLIWLLVYFCLRLITLRQKTRNPQRRRMYPAGLRDQHSVSQQEPTIYVSPSNLPPPPKYEALAPPSYDEVVGVHYPHYQSHGTPITQPITTALAQTSNGTANEVPPNSGGTVVPTATGPVLPTSESVPTVIIANERRSSVNAVAS